MREKRSINMVSFFSLLYVYKERRKLKTYCLQDRDSLCTDNVMPDIVPDGLLNLF